jgi:hypothetical protein
VVAKVEPSCKSCCVFASVADGVGVVVTSSAKDKLADKNNADASSVLLKIINRNQINK